MSQAIRRALALVNDPGLVHVVRREPLPAGVDLLLEVAVAEPAAMESAVGLTGASDAMLARAATFFIEQVLLAPDVDSYRVLGAARTADGPTLRRHMALLLRWSHPDKASAVDRSGNLDPSIFARRITAAWETLKTEERRAAYDHKLARAGRSNGNGRNKPSATTLAAKARPPKPLYRMSGPALRPPATRLPPPRRPSLRNIARGGILARLLSLLRRPQS